MCGTALNRGEYITCGECDENFSRNVGKEKEKEKENSSSDIMNSSDNSIMNASSKGATAPDGAEKTISWKLFCLKTGEEIPSGTYQRRGHFITCCGGNCIEPEVADEGCPDANCNCAEGWKIDDAPEPPHGEESAHKINNEDGHYQFPFTNPDLYDSDDERIMDQPVAIQWPTTKQPSKKTRDLTQTSRRRGQ